MHPLARLLNLPIDAAIRYHFTQMEFAVPTYISFQLQCPILFTYVNNLVFFPDLLSVISVVQAIFKIPFWK